MTVSPTVRLDLAAGTDWAALKGFKLEQISRRGEISQ